MNTDTDYYDMKNQLSYHKNLYYHKHFLSDFVFWRKRNYGTSIQFQRGPIHAARIRPENRSGRDA